MKILDIKEGQEVKLYHLLLAPVMGLVFAIFLPAIGIIMAGKILSKKIWTYLKHVASSYPFIWSPVVAYLSGRKR